MLSSQGRAVIDALCPSNACAELPLGAFDAGFEEFYAELSRTAPGALVWSFRGALLAAAWLSPLMIGRLPPFSRLSPEDGERALEALAKSRIYFLRQSVTLLKAVVSFRYGADERVRKAVGCKL